MKEIGKQLHFVIQRRLITGEFPDDLCDDVAKLYESIKYIVGNLKGLDFEVSCYHPKLNYRGRFDSIVSVR